jgi:hypothetical protein
MTDSNDQLSNQQQLQLFLCVRNPGNGIPDNLSQRQPIPTAIECCEHYCFDWGFILQRRAQQYVFLDYCFDDFHRQLQGGISLDRLQDTIFQMLAQHTEAPNDVFGLLNGDQPWIVLCSTYGAFSLVINTRYEREARQWSVNQLAAKILPAILCQFRNKHHGVD